MYFLDAMKVLFRRWYVVVIGVALVLGAGAAVMSSIPTNYQASGQLLFLLPANATGDEAPINPYLNLDPGLTATANVVAGLVTSAESREGMAAGGFSPDYAVAQPAGSTLPMLEVTVEDTDADRATASLLEIIDRLGAQLATIQTDVAAPDYQTITFRPYNLTDEAEPLTGSRFRSVAVVAVVGGLLTLAAAFLTDRVITQRVPRREANSTDPPPHTDAQVEKVDPRRAPLAQHEDVSAGRSLNRHFVGRRGLPSVGRGGDSAGRAPVDNGVLRR